jgi:hypothetical protein
MREPALYKLLTFHNRILISITGPEHKLCFLSAQLCENVTTESLPLPLILSFDDLEEDSIMEKCFYLRAHRVGDRNIIVKVGQLDLTHGCARWWLLVLQ